MDIREEVPIKSFSISAYVCRIEDGKGRYLILRRKSSYLSSSWQMVSGKIEKGEKAWEAALREITEETGLIPDRLYSVNKLEQFYEASQNCINLVPIFAGFVDSDQPVKLSPEHSEHKWVSPEESKEYLCFEHQTETMREIEAKFVKQKPLEFLRVKTK
jgi:dATP pyrophosphohydrolase